MCVNTSLPTYLSGWLPIYLSVYPYIQPYACHVSLTLYINAFLLWTIEMLYSTTYLHRVYQPYRNASRSIIRV